MKKEAIDARVNVQDRRAVARAATHHEDARARRREGRKQKRRNISLHREEGSSRDEDQGGQP